MVNSYLHDSHVLTPCDFYFFPQMKDQQKEAAGIKVTSKSDAKECA
jgi:hypothetical protein